MNDHTEQVDLKQLIQQSKRRANRLFWAVVVLLALFFISLLTALPQWIDRARSAQLGVVSAAAAERQAQLWQKNASCLTRASGDGAKANNIEVDTTICQSGDILVRARTPDGREFFKWVPLDEVVRPHTGSQLVAGASQ